MFYVCGLARFQIKLSTVKTHTVRQTMMVAQIDPFYEQIRFGI